MAVCRFVLPLSAEKLGAPVAGFAILVKHLALACHNSGAPPALVSQGVVYASLRQSL